MYEQHPACAQGEHFRLLAGIEYQASQNEKHRRVQKLKSTLFDCLKESENCIERAKFFAVRLERLSAASVQRVLEVYLWGELISKPSAGDILSPNFVSRAVCSCAGTGQPEG
jgi:hypothetical protein